MYGSLIHGGATLSGGGGEGSIGPLVHLDIEGVLPVDGIGFIHEPKVGIEYSKDEHSPSDEESGVLVVEFVVEMGHVVGVAFGVVLMGRVEDEPLADLEHGGQQVHVLLVGQLEILGTDWSALRELLC